jgi:hypothetical protein
MIWKVLTGGNLYSAQNIQQNSLRHSVHSPTPPIDHPSVVYDGDVTTERAYNTQRNYRASAGNYNSTVMDTLTTDIAQMGTRFSIQGPSNLEGDMLESHDYQPASPRQQHQHNHFSASGYSPPALTLSGNFGVHQFDSSRMLYSPMPGIGSGHTETHVTSEQSSPSLGVSEHSWSRYNTCLMQYRLCETERRTASAVNQAGVMKPPSIGVCNICYPSPAFDHLIISRLPSAEIS